MTVARDHLGQNYSSMTAMAAAWGVPFSTLLYRLEEGLSLERALNPKNRHWRELKDHTGQVFPSMAAMARAWNISYVTFTHRRKRHWPIKDILTRPVKVYARRKA